MTKEKNPQIIYLKPQTKRLWESFIVLSLFLAMRIFVYAQSKVQKKIFQNLIIYVYLMPKELLPLVSIFILKQQLYVNPSYLGGWDWEAHGSLLARG
jgi:hypothetical protein